MAHTQGGSNGDIESVFTICIDQVVADHAALGWHRIRAWLHITDNAM